MLTTTRIDPPVFALNPQLVMRTIQFGAPWLARTIYPRGRAICSRLFVPVIRRGNLVTGVGLSLSLLALVMPVEISGQETRLGQSSPTAGSKSLERSQYDIRLKLDFDSRSYAGSERVRWINRGERSTSSLYFHLYSNLRLDIQPTTPLSSNFATPGFTESDEPRIEVEEVQSLPEQKPLSFALDDQGLTLRVNLREPVSPGAAVEVLVRFKGSVPELDPEETGIVTHVIKQVSAALRSERETRRARDMNFRCRGVMLLGTPYPVLA
ncbi:MAG: hypothetical protein ACREBC_30075, partial [Pyrinomonadaceae bacterium]